MNPVDLSNYSKFVLKFSGQSFNEKLEVLKVRYQKVIEDSENDRSTYRTSFSAVHQAVLVRLSAGFNLHQVLNYCLIDQDKEYLPGEKDAKAIIQLEILSILE